jgi:hypothetical protein
MIQGAETAKSGRTMPMFFDFEISRLCAWNNLEAISQIPVYV